jgi:MoxR-like ATPase
MNNAIFEKIEEEIKKVEKDGLKKALRETEIAFNNKISEFVNHMRNNPQDIKSRARFREEIAKLAYKRDLLREENEKINEYSKNLVERERAEFRERAKETAKKIAKGELQVDSFLLRMLLVHGAGQVPYLEGETGIGKSERIRQYADIIGAKYVKVMLTGKEKVHIEGNIIPEVIEKGEYPNVDAKIDAINKYVESGESSSTHNKRDSLLVHKNTIPEFLNQVLNALSRGEHVVLHFDEFLRADREVFNTIMDFILENYVEAFHGRLKTGRLHKVASGNPPDIYDGYELDPAQKQRFVFMKVEPNLSEFIKVVAPKKDIHPSIIEFLQEHSARDAFHTARKHREMNGSVADEVGGEYIGINPRKWTMINELIKVYEEDYSADPDTKQMMFNVLEETLLEDAESYGEKELIRKFLTYYKNSQKLSLRRVKSILTPYYEDIYYVQPGDAVSRPLEGMFKAVENIFKSYQNSGQLDDNKRFLLLEDAFNNFNNEFIDPIIKEIGRSEKDMTFFKEKIKEQIDEDPSKIMPFFALLKLSGPAGLQMVQGKFNAKEFNSNALNMFEAFDTLFNTGFLSDYISLSLDVMGKNDLKNEIKEKESLTLEEMLGIDIDGGNFIDEDMNFDFENEEKDAEKKNDGGKDVGTV